MSEGPARPAADELPRGPPPRPAAGSPGRGRLFWREWGWPALVGIGLGLLPLPWNRLFDSLWSVLAWGLALLLAAWVNTLLHEAGHGLAGRARGMHPLAFGLGPWRWERGRERWHARRGGAVAGVGGFAVMVPALGRASPRLDEAAFLLGGPLANLVVAGAGFSALAVVELPQLARVPLAALAWTGLALGVVNLVPWRRKGWRTDGMGLLGILRGGAETELRLASLQVAAASVAGARPREWPPLPAFTQARDPLVAAAADVQRLLRAVDRGEPEDAAAAAGRLVAGLPALPVAFQASLRLALAFHELAENPDAARLRELLEHSTGTLLDTTAWREWLAAECAALAGDADAARRHLAAVDAAMPRFVDAGMAVLLGERRARLVERLNARETAGSCGSGLGRDGELASCRAGAA